MQHDGWIELSDVEGMTAKDGSGKTVNDAGRIKIKTCKKKVIYCCFTHAIVRGNFFRSRLT